MRRAGGVERVTGAQKYAADIRLDHPLHVKLVYVDCAHARIRSIDSAEALRVAGVRCVFTAADLPRPVPLFGPAIADRPVIADGETLFHGEPVAAVAAEAEDAAEMAAPLVRVEYEERPAVLTVDDALAPSCPFKQDKTWRFGWGDVDGARADLVIENTYTFPMVTHFAIEPHVFMAAPDANSVVVWSPIQHPYVLQRVVAQALGWPLAKVRIVAPDPGGGFGGKGWPKLEPLMAYLALHTGRPVRLALSLEETFQQVRRTSARTRARSGFDKDGRICFQDIEADFLIGAYADIATRVVSKAGYSACGPYRTPNARIAARALHSHTTPSTAFRGFGTPQACWAVESQLDEAARRLGIDRVEIRRRNLPAPGEEFIPGDTPADGRWAEAVDRAASAIGWGLPLAPRRGRGLSLGLKSSSTASVSFAIVRLHGDGSVSVLTATSDMGQGARTVFAELAAEELGVPADRVMVVMGDTAVVPFDSSTSASRSTVFMGNAIVAACAEVKAKLRAMAEAIGAGEGISPAELMRRYYGGALGEVIGAGEARSEYIAGHPLGGKAAFWEFMCVAAEVEVDPETGMVDVHRLVLASDVGKALSPQQVEAQDEGAAVMGLGHTLMEHLILDDHGRIMNRGALDYRIPTIQDIPGELHSILIENGDGPGPRGAKGAGEGGILTVSAAIGSAIAEATGAVIRDLPMTPERVWREIRLSPKERTPHG
jgi:CO/xanthine dehydrogenase Mo-binding subunit